MTFLEIDADGVEYIYLDSELNPTDKKNADMVKLVYPDGRVEFAITEKG